MITGFLEIFMCSVQYDTLLRSLVLELALPDFSFSSVISKLCSFGDN